MFQLLIGLLAGVSLGGIVYTSFLVAPIIFTVLDDPEATRFTRVMWPRYFWSHAFIALVLEAMLVYESGRLNPPALAAGAAGLLMLINVVLAGRMRTLRDPGEEQTSDYRWMHRFTVWANITVGALMASVLSWVLFA